MMMIQQEVDVVQELTNLLPSYYEIIVPSIVLDELDILKRKVKGKDKLAASIARQIAVKEPFKIYEIEKTQHVDNILLKLCTTEDILCTNDRRLRQKAREKHITVLYLRQHRYLAIDGYIKR
jgi:hypothetical protein